ncbi:MAG TPA: NAD(P)/FAD-dependent oxidoreductase [Methanosarcinales archaeon]|nr:NAD(P)/FAD-dependent oxidoreductase [Methanosarcinales archaeon]
MDIDKKYDVIIVGAGPAGMFAANELSSDDLKVLIIDSGRSIEHRKCPMGEPKNSCARCYPCNIMCGVGGSGTFSDGTLNLRPDIGGNLIELTKNQDKAWELVDYVDKIFLKYGAPNHLYSPDGEEVELLKRRAASVGAKFIETPQRHIGSDNAPKIIKNFEEDLKKRGVDFLLNSTVEDLIIKNGSCKGVKLKGGLNEIKSENTIIAPGRIGVSWVNDMVDRHKISAKYGPIDVGVRVEVPAIIMDPITKINRDPKFHIRTKRYDDFIRTFCTNEHGFVVKESYEDFIATNGHSMQNEASENTNFAFLVQLHLTHPIENTSRYGKSIAKLATTIGGGKPVLQRMGDLRRGRRSTFERLERNQVVNTLKDVTPGDISMALPHRIVMDIIEGLEVLNQIIPGVASDSTLLYAPEIKFYAMQIQVHQNMETNIKNLFAAGDGAGLSRDIVNAAATGVLAARGVLGDIHEN